VQANGFIQIIANCSLYVLYILINDQDRKLRQIDLQRCLASHKGIANRSRRNLSRTEDFFDPCGAARLYSGYIFWSFICQDRRKKKGRGGEGGGGEGRKIKKRGRKGQNVYPLGDHMVAAGRLLFFSVRAHHEIARKLAVLFLWDPSPPPSTLPRYCRTTSSSHAVSQRE
jgi:hypothetical protein